MTTVAKYIRLGFKPERSAGAGVLIKKLSLKALPSLANALRMDLTDETLVYLKIDEAEQIHVLIPEQGYFGNPESVDSLVGQLLVTEASASQGI